MTADSPLPDDNISSPGREESSPYAAAIAWEENYWKKHHAAQSYAKQGAYDRFHTAYQTGYVGYFSLGIPGIPFEDNEERLRDIYETEGGPAQLPWNVARSAVQAAWARLSGPEEMRA